MEMEKLRTYLPPEEIDFVIFHGGCPDGFGGAYCFWRILGGEYQRRIEIDEMIQDNTLPKDKIIYYPGTHGYDPPDVTGRNVAIVDFSYKREILNKMKEQANRLIILDHHISAQRDLEGFPNAIFDMNRSGAMIAWDFCNKGIPAPQLIKYIQDRDIWTWKEPDSKEFSSGFSEEPLDFNVFNLFVKNENGEIENAIRKGRNILQFSKIQRERMLRRVQIRKLNNYRVAVLNSNIWISELGHEMSQLENVNGELVDCALIWSWDHK